MRFLLCLVAECLNADGNLKLDGIFFHFSYNVSLIVVFSTFIEDFGTIAALLHFLVFG